MKVADLIPVISPDTLIYLSNRFDKKINVYIKDSLVALENIEWGHRLLNAEIISIKSIEYDNGGNTDNKTAILIQLFID